MAELTAAGIYVHFWFPAVPQYLTALVMLIVLVLLNLIAVGAFGEAEFWFASIKIAAILALIIGGSLVLIFSIGHAGKTGTLANLWNHHGIAPHGWFSVLLAFQIVVFAYQGVELVGMTAAEARDRATTLPRPSIASRGGSGCSTSARSSSCWRCSRGPDSAPAAAPSCRPSPTSASRPPAAS
jgi:amino acid transporter, AAT family